MTLTLCVCMGCDHSCHGIEGQRSRSRVIAVGLTSILNLGQFSSLSIVKLVCHPSLRTSSLIMYISRLCYDVSVRLSVVSNSDPSLPRIVVTAHIAPACTANAGELWSQCMPGRGEGSSCTMLANTRPSCFVIVDRISEW